jgi:hypothetical protein
MEFEDSLVSELETQEGLARDVHDNVQKVNIQAQGLMDDQINNLKLANKKLDSLVVALDTIILELEKLD